MVSAGGTERKSLMAISPRGARKLLAVAAIAACLVALGTTAALAQRAEQEPTTTPSMHGGADLSNGETRSLAAARPDLSPSIAAARRSLDAPQNQARQLYANTFSSAADAARIDNFVHYRDPFVVNHTVGASDHASTGGDNCAAPETTRLQTRDNPHGHIYHCLPAGDAALGHMMAFAMDSSGYGFAGGLPDQVFQGVEEVSVDINTTSAGGRNFIEIKILPASETFVNAMPCGPDLPCNDGWDYDDIGGVGASTSSQDGTGLMINTPQRPDGYTFDLYNRATTANGDVHYSSCDDNPNYCFRAVVHDDNDGIRQRYSHVFRDNGDGTLSFGIDDGGTMHWVTAPGAFPDGPVRVVIAFHSYTGTKDGNGPGFADNLSPSSGGFTWHWDNLVVVAAQATPADDWFDGPSADRIVTPDGCIAFSQGQRGSDHNTDIAPELRCGVGNR